MATFTTDLISGKQYLFNGNFSNSGTTIFSGITCAINGLTCISPHNVMLGGALTCSTIITKGAGNTAGIEYGGDYSASFTNRSLVDKGYVVSQVSGISWNTITNKSQWLSGTTLNKFQTGHTHSYSNLTNKLSGGTGITIDNNVINNLPAKTTLQLIDITGNTNVNTIPVKPINWSLVEYAGTSLSFTGGSKIYILSDGVYALRYVLNFVSQSEGTKNVGAVIRKNGNTYITPSTNVGFSISTPFSAGTNTMPLYETTLLTGDYIELVGYRIGDFGSVLTVPNASWITVFKQR